jgi:hypothetical protein
MVASTVGRPVVPPSQTPSGPSPLRHRPSGALIAAPQRAHSTDSESHAHAAPRAERAIMPAVLEPQVVTVRNRSGRRAGYDRHRSSGAGLSRINPSLTPAVQPVSYSA